jgi:hypothetical protein
MKVTRFGIMLTAAELREAASDVAEKVVTSGTEKINDAVSGNLLTAEGMDHALGAISQKVGANPMQVVEVIISPSALSVQAVDPNAPNELNQWSYTAGTVGPSRPVDYDDDTEALQQNLFAIGDVPTSAIAAAIDAAVPASDIKDGAVQSVSVKRNLPFDDNVIIFVNVTSDRSSKQVRADSTGQVTQVV